MQTAIQLKAFATEQHIHDAISALSDADWLRLHKVAGFSLLGTGLSDPGELVSEAFVRTLRGCRGENGRHWPLDVPFMAFLVETIKSIANISREAWEQTHVQPLATVCPELDDETALGVLGHAHPSVEKIVISEEEAAIRKHKERSAMEAIEQHFSTDEQVAWLILGVKDDLSAADIQALSGMNVTQYATARRRFRRWLEKLFQTRAPS